MSWVNDLTSALGVPAGAVVIGTAFCGALIAAEKRARPEALADITRISKDPSWTSSNRPSAIIQAVFEIVFDTQQWSSKCIRRSVLATIIFILAIMIALHLEGRTPNLPKSCRCAGLSFKSTLKMVQLIIVIGFLPDYLALAKTRLLLHVCAARISAITVLIIDVILSLIISVAFLGIYEVITQGSAFYLHPLRIMNAVEVALSPLIMSSSRLPVYSLYTPFLFSTLLTSIWATLVLLSTAVLKLLLPVQRFTVWFFDIEKHPLEAIGFVGGTGIIVGSLLYSLLVIVVRSM